MRAIVLLLLLMGAGCRSSRMPAINAPADEAEYYQLGQPTFAGQQRIYPDPHGGLGHSQDPDIRVTNIRLTASYTVLYLTFAKDKNDRNSNYFGMGTSSISFNPKAVLASADGKRTYRLLKTEGIPMTPDSREIRNDERVSFILYFERLDPGVDRFDLFECQSDNENSCFNVAGMTLPDEAQTWHQPPK